MTQFVGASRDGKIQAQGDPFGLSLCSAFGGTARASEYLPGRGRGGSLGKSAGYFAEEVPRFVPNDAGRLGPRRL